jgi:hypothetical protein
VIGSRLKDRPERTGEWVIGSRLRDGPDRTGDSWDAMNGRRSVSRRNRGRLVGLSAVFSLASVSFMIRKFEMCKELTCGYCRSRVHCVCSPLDEVEYECHRRQ